MKSTPILEIKKTEEKAREKIKKKKKELEEKTEKRIHFWEDKKQEILNDYKKQEEDFTNILKGQIRQIEQEFNSQYEKEIIRLSGDFKKNFKFLKEKALNGLFHK